MKAVGPGDIVMWIRTNEHINNIKANLGSIFKNKFLSTLGYQCSIKQNCQQTTGNVDLVSQIISGTYRDVKPEPTQEQLEIQRKKELRVERPVRQQMYAPVTMREYTSHLRVPRLQDNGEDIFERYWKGEDVWKPDFVFEKRKEENSVEHTTRLRRWLDESNREARIGRFLRLKKAVAVKNVVKYVMEMIDYFHQRLDLPFTSQTFIDAERNFFYGHDIGKHDHLTGPTPILTDLIDHMYDVRIGLVFIDELCYLLMRGLSQFLQADNTLEDDIWVQFLERVVAGAKRYDSKDPWERVTNYVSFKRFNYIADIQSKFKDKVPEPPKAYSYDKRKEKGKVIVEDTLNRFEIERLYARNSLCSLRNYYEAAKALGVENIFAFMEPDGFNLPKLETDLEKKTGQLSVMDDLLLPWYVDGYRIRRPDFLFLSHWRTIVTHISREVFDQMLDEMQKNKRLGDLARLRLVDKREYLLSSFLIVGGLGSMRGELNKLVNSVMIEAGKVCEERYMTNYRDPPLHLQDRRIATLEQEYHTYNDVFEYIKLNNPDWEKEVYRRANPILWITGLNDLFGTRREPGQFGNLAIKSLTDIESGVLFQLDGIISYYQEQDMI